MKIWIRRALIVGCLTFGCATFPRLTSASDADSDAPPGDLSPVRATAAEVLALEPADTANAATTYRERWNVSRLGLTGTLTLARSGDDLRVDSELGPFTSSVGRYRGKNWRMTPNGQVVELTGIHQRDEIDAEALASERVEPGEGVSVIGMRADPKAYVLQVAPPHGRKKWLFIDPTNGHVVRIESIVLHERFIAEFSDFRAEYGRTFAHHVHVSTAAGTELGTFTLAQDDPVPTTLDLSIPVPNRRLVEFPADASRVDIPAVFRKGHVIVRVTIGGRGLDCILDSGASTILLNAKVARELRLPFYGSSQQTVAGPVTISQTIVPKMSVAGLTLRNVAIDMGPIDANVTSDIDAVGLVGFDFIDGAVIHIDYQHQKVEALRTDVFHPESIPGAFAIPIALDDGVPTVPVILGKTLSRRFLVDTGSDATMIFSNFAREHPADVKDQGRGDNLIVHGGLFFFAGVGGVGEIAPTELRELHFGPTIFTDFIAYRTKASEFEGEDLDGLIGSPILSFYDVYFDYASARIVVIPNDKYRHSVRR